MLSTLYRKIALRVCRDFRNISDEAVYAVARMLPIDILVDEIMHIYSVMEAVLLLIGTRKMPKRRSL